MSLRGALRKNPTESKLLAASLPWRKSLFAAFLCSNVQVAVTRTFAFFFKGALRKSREKNLVRCFRKGGVLNPVRKKACPRAGRRAGRPVRRPVRRPRSRLARAGGHAWAALCRAASRPRCANQQKRCALHNVFADSHIWVMQICKIVVQRTTILQICTIRSDCIARFVVCHAFPYARPTAYRRPGRRPANHPAPAGPHAKRSRAARGSFPSYLTR